MTKNEIVLPPKHGVGEGDNLAFLAAKTREKHKNETLRLCSEFQRRQPKKRANPGRGQQTRIKYCHNFIF